MDTGAYSPGRVRADNHAGFMSESESMGKQLRMKIRSDPAQLGRVRGEVEAFARRAGLPEPAAGQVVLALDEALTNIIRHAYEGATDRPIEIDVSVRNGELGLVLRDYGKVIDRMKIRSRDLNDLRPGGLGVYIMNECMDGVEFTPAEGGGTRLTMTKTLPERERTNGPNDE